MLRAVIRRGAVARSSPALGTTSLKSVAATTTTMTSKPTTANKTAMTRVIAAAYAASANGSTVWARRFSPEFIVSMNKSIKLLAERGEWWFAQAWIPNDDGCAVFAETKRSEKNRFCSPAACQLARLGVDDARRRVGRRRGGQQGALAQDGPGGRLARGTLARLRSFAAARFDAKEF